MKKQTPHTRCFGSQTELNKLTDLVRGEIARCNYAELLTEVLVSWKENFDFLQKPRDNSCVVLAAPQSSDFEICRTSLMAGLLKALKTNRAAALPLRVFQVDDVVLRDATTDTGARNERRICAAYTNKAAGLEVIHGARARMCACVHGRACAEHSAGLLDKLCEVLRCVEMCLCGPLVDRTAQHQARGGGQAAVRAARDAAPVVLRRL